MNEEDRALLSKFCGFGAFATTAFPNPATGEYAKGWESLGEGLRNVLTKEEYAEPQATPYESRRARRELAGNHTTPT